MLSTASDVKNSTNESSGPYNHHSLQTDIDILTQNIPATQTPALYYLRAKLYYQLGKPEEFIKDILKAIHYDIRAEDPKNHLSQPDRFEIIFIILKYQLHIENLQDPKELSTKLKKDRSNLIKEAKKELQNKNFQAVKKAYKKALSYNAYTPSDYLDLGEAYQQLGEYLEAECCFHLAEWIAPSTKIFTFSSAFEALCKLQNLKVISDELPQALDFHRELCDKATQTKFSNKKIKPLIEYKEDFSKRLVEKGKTISDNHHALEYFNNAITAFPHPDAFLHLALTLTKLEKKQEAEKAVNEGLQLESGHMQLKQLWKKLRKKEISTAILPEHYQEKAAYFAAMGVYAFDKALWEEAIHYFDLALKEHSEDEGVQLYRLRALLECNSTLNKVKLELLEVSRQKPNNGIYDFLLAQCFFKQQNKPQVIYHLLRTIDKELMGENNSGSNFFELINSLLFTFKKPVKKTANLPKEIEKLLAEKKYTNVLCLLPLLYEPGSIKEYIYQTASHAYYMEYKKYSFNQELLELSHLALSCTLFCQKIISAKISIENWIKRRNLRIELGDLEGAQQDHANVLEHYQFDFKYNKEFSILLRKQGSDFLQRKNFHLAEKFLKYAVEVLENVNNPEDFDFRLLAENYLTLAILYREKNDTSQALIYLQRARENDCDVELYQAELNLLNKPHKITTPSLSRKSLEEMNKEAEELVRVKNEWLAAEAQKQKDKEERAKQKAEKEELIKKEKAEALDKRLLTQLERRKKKNKRKKENLKQKRREARDNQATQETSESTDQKDTPCLADEKLSLPIYQQKPREHSEIKKLTENHISTTPPIVNIEEKKSSDEKNSAEQTPLHQVTIEKLIAEQTLAQSKEMKPLQWPDAKSHRIAKIELTPTEKEIMNRLAQSGGSVFMTGSTVRDRVLHQLHKKNSVTPLIYRKKDQDIDFVATTQSKFIYQKFPEARALMVPNAFRIDGLPKIDIQLSQYHSLLEDAQSRCLTVNALMADIEGNVYAPLPNSRQDLLNRQLNTIQPAPTALNNDPLIAFRAIKLDADESASLKMSFDLTSAIKARSNFLLPSADAENNPHIIEKRNKNYHPMRINHWILSHLCSDENIMVFDAFLKNDIWKKLFPSPIADQIAKDHDWIRQQLSALYHECKSSNRSFYFDDVYMIFIISTLSRTLEKYTLADANDLIQSSALLKQQFLKQQFRHVNKLEDAFHKWAQIKSQTLPQVPMHEAYWQNTPHLAAGHTLFLDQKYPQKNTFFQGNALFRKSQNNQSQLTSGS